MIGIVYSIAPSRLQCSGLVYARDEAVQRVGCMHSDRRDGGVEGDPQREAAEEVHSRRRITHRAHTGDRQLSNTHIQTVRVLVLTYSYTEDNDTVQITHSLTHRNHVNQHDDKSISDPRCAVDDARSTALGTAATLSTQRTRTKITDNSR